MCLIVHKFDSEWFIIDTFQNMHFKMCPKKLQRLAFTLR